MLTRYVKNEDNQKIGVVVAIERGQIGWSRCRMGDKFDKALGIKIAIGRAKKESKKRIPDALLRTVIESYKAAEVYYHEVKCCQENKVLN